MATTPHDSEMETLSSENPTSETSSWCSRYGRIPLKYTDPDVLKEAKQRIEKRISEIKYGIQPRIDEFLKEHKCLTDAYVVHGIPKSKFVMRIINHRFNFPKKKDRNQQYSIQNRIREMFEKFLEMSIPQKSDTLEEIIAICSLPDFKEFVKDNWSSSVHEVTFMLRESFESENATLIELAAFAATTISIHTPGKFYRKNQTGHAFFQSMVIAFIDCFKEQQRFNEELHDAENAFYDADKAGKKFVYGKFSSTFNGAKHRLASVLYYSMTFVITNMNSGYIILWLGSLAIKNTNPVLFLLLHMLDKVLIAFDDKFNTCDNYRVALSKLSLRLASLEEGEMPRLPSQICQCLINSCNKSIRAKTGGIGRIFAFKTARSKTGILEIHHRTKAYITNPDDSRCIESMDDSF